MMEAVKLVSGKQAVAYRNYRRARDRALSRLAQAYPEQYKEYLQEEKASDETQGKNWVGADTFITVSTMDTRADSATTRPRSSNGAEDEGNNGGEA